MGAKDTITAPVFKMHIIQVHTMEWRFKSQVGNTHLEEDHIPEALQVTGGNLLLPSAILAVLHKTGKLLESFGHQQLRLSYHCSDTAINYNHNSCINTTKTLRTISGSLAYAVQKFLVLHPSCRCTAKYKLLLSGVRSCNGDYLTSISFNKLMQLTRSSAIIFVCKW